MRMICLRALFLLGWLGIMAGGGAMLCAQQKVVYDQYFYFNSFETDADLEGWESGGRVKNLELDGGWAVNSGDTPLISPEFDLSGVASPVVCFFSPNAPSNNNDGLLRDVFISEDGVNYKAQTSTSATIERMESGYRIAFPVSKKVKRIKIDNYYVAAFCLYNAATGGQVSERVVFNGFETAGALEGWETDGAITRYSSWNYDKGEQYLSCNSLVSPALDLTDMQEPQLSVVTSRSLKVSVSSDGINYQLLSECGAPYSGYVKHRFLLPRTTCRIKLEGTEGAQASVDNVCICDRALVRTRWEGMLDAITPAEVVAEAAPGLAWRWEGDSLILEGTATGGCAAWLTVLSGQSSDRGEIRLNFKWRNASPERVSIVAGQTEITAEGEAMIDFKGFSTTSVFSCVLKIPVKSAGPVRVAVSGLAYVYRGSGYSLKPERWYEDIPDNGWMELFIDSKGYWGNYVGLNRIVHGQPFSYKTYSYGGNYYGPEPNFVNVNNDNAVDLFISYNSEDCSSCPPYLYIRDEQGKLREKSVEAKGNKMFLADINNDGRPDWFMTDGQVYVQNADGTFLEKKVRLMTSSEWENGGRNDSWSGSGGGLIVQDWNDALHVDLIVGSGSGVYHNLGNSVQSIDFNGDGRPDLLNSITGQLLLNMGNDTYVTVNIGGQAYFRDLNGDGLLDYVLYDDGTKVVKAVIRESDGTEREEVLMEGISLDGQLWCYDLDKDGDVDILLPFSYDVANAAAYLVVMENDGQGRFTMHESYTEEKVLFRACADVNHDGVMDVVAQAGTREYSSYYKKWEETLESPYRVYLFRGNGDLTFSLQPQPLATLKSKSENILVADVNGDGRYEMVAPDTVVCLQGVTPNQVPEKMATPEFLYEAATGNLKVMWEAGRDAETSPADLTYALRIGSAPGKGDMFYAHAYADGRRRNLLEGNMGHDLSKVLSVGGWPEGRYYMAVQAVDPVCGGSPWSEEMVFEKTGVTQAPFTVSRAKTVMDSVTVVYEGTYNPKYRYLWDFDGGRIGAASEDSVKRVLCYDIPGEKTVSMKIADAAGNLLASSEKSFFVFANKFEKGGVTYDVSTSPLQFVDLDGNGVMDVIAENGVFEGDGQGNFTKVKKIYNTNLEFSNVKLVDVSGNGIADIVDYSDRFDGDYYATAAIYKNAGGMTLTKPSSVVDMTGCVIEANQDESPGRGGSTFFDVDNDGKEDYFINTYGATLIHRNLGDYISWQRIFELGGFANMFPADANRDGYWDWVCCDRKGSYDEGYYFELALYINHGNGNFERKVLPNPFGKEHDVVIRFFADMNNDGYPDLVVRKNESTLVICLNNANQDFNETVEVSLPGFKAEVIVLKDFDNNGYPDLYVGNTSMAAGNLKGIVYFYPGMEWKLWDYTDYSEARLVYGSDTFVDVNGDGAMDCPARSFINLTSVTNTPPAAPQHVRGVQTDTSVVLEWDAAQDRETPPLQMRYNVSVKKKGVSGDGAFIVSPLNGLNEQAAVIPDRLYRMATRMEIPLPALPAGEYEVQVQAIDAWDAPSPFSAVYELKVGASPKMALPEAVCAGLAATVRYMGNAGTARPEWDWDGGEAVAVSDSVYQVVWTVPGMKHVSVTVDGNVSEADLYVRALPDAGFTVPSSVLLNAEVTVALPESVSQGYALEWKVKREGGEWGEVFDHDVYIQTNWGPVFDKYVSPVKILRRGNTREAKAVFKEEGVYTLQLRLMAACGVVTAERQVRVQGAIPPAEIGLVTVDAATGKNRIAWARLENLPEYAEKINIYKEGNRYNDYYLLASVGLDETVFIDQSSAPEITSSRYRLTVATALGAESEPGAPHRSVHVMINKGVRGWNLTWSAYEGAVVESYRILRGNSPDALVVVAEVAGSALSWSDPEAPEGDVYYALAYDTPYEDTWTPVRLLRTRAAATAEGRSNVVSVADAVRTVPAASVTIRCAEGEAVLNTVQRQLHLSADVLPLSATFRNVSWQVIEGGDLAAVSASGLLTAAVNGNGTVRVRAAALDGSEAADTLMVQMSGEALAISGISVTDASGEESADGTLTISTTGGIQPLSYSVNGGGSFVGSGLFTGLRAGQYRVVVTDAEGSRVEYENNPVVVGVAPAPEELKITAVDVRDVSAEGVSDGWITVTATGGRQPLSYSVDGGNSYKSSNIFTDLSAGEYRVRVADADGVTVDYGQNPVIVGVPTGELRITDVRVTDVTEYGGSDGWIVIVATGGVPPLSYSIGEGYVSPDTFGGCRAGEYTVSVKDAAGTVVSRTIVVGQSEAPESVLNVWAEYCQNISVYGEADGKIILSSSGGKAPRVYSVDNGITFSADSVFSGLTAGEYYIAVKDAAGNISYGENNPVVLTQPERPEEPVYALKIEDFRLQGGVTVTGSCKVTLNQHVTGGVPLFYQVCEDTLNVGNSWNIYQLLPVYELSTGAGTKTVYIRVKGEEGLSHWAVASVRYEEISGLRIEQIWVNNGVTYIAEPRIRLSVIVAGEAQEMQVTVNGWDSGWKAWQSETGYELTEGEGDYVCRVKVRNAQGESEEASVSFVYKQAPRKLSVEDFALQGGSSYTLNRTVTLDHWVDGGMPVVYAASEYPDLRDARWLRYQEQPEYTLQGKAGMKTVYFAVASGRDTSETVSAQILLDEQSGSGLNVRVWPNPVNDVLHIMLTDEDAADETRVTVHTAMGQLVEQRICRGREISLDVSRYPFGILFVELMNNGRKTVKQILKK